MSPERKARLESSGFRIGGVAEFLELSPEESDMVEIRVALAKLVRDMRKGSGLTQARLAAKLRSSQSRIAKRERRQHGLSGHDRTSFACTRRYTGKHRKSAWSEVIRHPGSTDGCSRRAAATGSFVAAMNSNIAESIRSCKSGHSSSGESIPTP